MRSLTIKIKADGSAFGRDIADAKAELTRVLREYVRHIENGGALDQPLYSSDTQACGYAELDGPED